MRIAVDGIYFGCNSSRTPEDFVALAAASGADAVNWPYHPAYWPDDPARVSAALGAVGLSVVSVGLTEQISATPGQHDRFREVFTLCASFAAAVGAPIVDCWPHRPADVTKPAAQAALAANLDAVVPIARDAGVIVAFEFEPDQAIERYAEAAEFLAPWRPAAKPTADTYHIIRIGDDLIAAGTALGGSIGVVHFSASHRGEPGSEGDRCDYNGFLASALQSGFQGDVVLQYAPPTDTQHSLKRAVALAREVVAWVS
jgi:sugar phosphate isomerase/epimerase